MLILFDTNIILDILEKRQPFYEASKSVLEECFSAVVESVGSLDYVEVSRFLFPRAMRQSHACMTLANAARSLIVPLPKPWKQFQNSSLKRDRNVQSSFAFLR